MGNKFLIWMVLFVRKKEAIYEPNPDGHGGRTLKERLRKTELINNILSLEEAR